MSIKTDILAGMKKSRKKYFRSDELDNFAIDNMGFGSSFPTTHGVRARISELTTDGKIIRTQPNQYTLGETDA